MKLTITEIQGTKYVQIYLTEDELQKKETKDLIKKYKQEKYHIIDDNCETDARWIEVDKFINKELKIYTEQMFKYLT